MKVILTGADGFLGSALLKTKSNIRFFSLSHAKNFKYKDNEAEIELSDTVQIEKLAKSLKGQRFDQLIHFAASTPYSKRKGKPDYITDVKIAENIALLCKLLQIPRVLFLSGWVVYSPSCTPPISENCQTMPVTDYGKSKILAENILRKKLNKCTLVVVRASSIYGPGQISSGLIPTITADAISKMAITITTPNIKRDYLFIEDFTKFIKKIIYTSFPDETIINIGSGESYKISDIAQYVLKIVSSIRKQAIQIDIDNSITKVVPMDNRLNIKKAVRITKYKPSINIQEGLKKYIEWKLDIK